MTTQYYVYLHIRPDTNSIFYVGIGSDRNRKYVRAHDHRQRERNNIWWKIYLKNNHQIQTVIFNSYPTIEESQAAEIQLIALLGRKSVKTGELANIALGGTAAAPTRSIVQFDKAGNRIREWDSVNQAVEALGVDRANVYAALKGLLLTSGGYAWRWLDDCPSDEVIQMAPNGKFQSVEQLTMDGEFIKTWPNLAQAARAIGVSVECVSRASNGRPHTKNYSAGGFKWRRTLPNNSNA